MPIQSIRDVIAAHDAGRVHRQRFIKTGAQPAQDNCWFDWAYAAGQPAFDARIGTGLAFNPQVAARNDAIWFPDVEPGMHRHLSGLQIHNTYSGNDPTNTDYLLYDLLGVYPLIDGDSTDPQDMDNTLTLPRYTDGEGVQCALVNHVAPFLAAAQNSTIITYTNSKGVNGRTVTLSHHASGTGRVQHRVSAATSGLLPHASMPLAAGDTGIRQIDSIQFTTPPGGLACLYLFKPLAHIAMRGGTTGSNTSCVTMVDYTLTGMPRIYDGAHLGFFIMGAGGGTARNVSAIFGQASFIWG